MIKVENVTKKFGPVKALDDVSFEVQKGEILGFLGPNGAGKTTAMRILTGFFPPTQGKVWFDGVDVEHKGDEIKRRIGYLPEMVPLYADMTVQAFLKFVSKIKGVAKRQAATEIERVTGDCGIGDITHRRIGHLSKGYRQRVGLAQALIGSPDLLILDEPTTGLDPKQIIEIRSLIKRLAGRHTVILSTHILPEVSLLCERIMVINKGRIVATDTAEAFNRQLKEKHEIRVLVKADLARVSALLSQIQGVREIKCNEAGEGCVECFVFTELDEDLRSAVANQIMKAGLELLEISSVKMTLEDIFLELVTEEKGVGPS